MNVIPNDFDILSDPTFTLTNGEPELNQVVSQRRIEKIKAIPHAENKMNVVLKGRVGRLTNLVDVGAR